MNVDFLTAIKLFFANYANFRGRSTRAEYWWVALFLVIVSLAFSMLKHNLLSTIFSLAVFIPSLAIAFRRFHDTGRSGWWVFAFYVVAWIGAAIMLGPLVSIVITMANDPDALREAMLGYFTNHPVAMFLGLILILAAGIWQLIILVMPSAPDNKYGPNPYGENA